MRGLFISMEGPDKAGKSTQTKLLYEYLQAKGVDALLTREPGSTPVGEKIRNVILSTDNDMGDVCEAMLYAAARAEHVRTVLQPQLDAGKTIVCDRYVDSSIAYQGYGRQLGHEYVQQLNDAAIDGLYPDLTIFLYMDPDAAIERIEQKAMDRLEITDDAFRHRVMEGYLILEQQYQNRYVRIEAAQPIEAVHNDIVSVVEQWL
ncbi:dTMP kinase [Eubacteriales bacterium OttesenSCG-928-N14]|nr:dTMP kinase [Eubacteriales bacterium OttesenSCG-928-N14]